MPADNLQDSAKSGEAKAAAHTPGPWSFAPAVPGAKHCFYIAGNNDAHNRQVDIGTVEGGYYSCEANARLIAAAPDLLEALKGLLDVLDKLSESKALHALADAGRLAGPDFDYEDAMRAVRAAQAALSRAGSAQ